MTILVTGGTGYIGSHTVVELIEAGHEPIIVDNLSNSSEIVLERIETITGKRPIFYNCDASDVPALQAVFEKHRFESVIHFAALKAVDTSVAEPTLYYRNNLGSLLAMLECIRHSKVEQVIFSSSATVYGEPAEIPLKETSRIGQGITNPYGQTKCMGEQILTDVARANPNLSVTLLRYFNPIGAHKSGLIGEDPNGPPDNLVPYLSQVAVGKRPYLRVFGNDYDTPDGTGIRDYIHVVDVAQGHLAALNHRSSAGLPDIYNLCTGQGYSVLEIVAAFEKASGKKISCKILDRRPGDIAECYADPGKAHTELNWQATRSLNQMCEDAWRWQSRNPDGYTNQ